MEATGMHSGARIGGRPATRRPRGGRVCLALLVVGLSGLACLAQPFTGSTVVVDFLDDLVPSSTVRLPDGSSAHYELWVQFGDQGVLSIGRFIVDGDLHVLSYPDGTRRIGSVTGADDNRRSGVNFTSQANLSHATDAFVTLEPDGETDAAPSGDVIMSGALTSPAKGDLRGEMTGQYQNRLGVVLSPFARITIIIAEDNAFF
jgi:hypothetical protein